MQETSAGRKTFPRDRQIPFDSQTAASFSGPHHYSHSCSQPSPMTKSSSPTPPCSSTSNQCHRDSLTSPHYSEPTQPAPSASQHHDFTILHKNARSLCTDDKFDELLAELQNIHWHVIALNETWRTEKRELWTTKNEHHVYAGSGHNKSIWGVGSSSTDL